MKVVRAGSMQAPSRTLVLAGRVMTEEGCSRGEGEGRQGDVGAGAF